MGYSFLILHAKGLDDALLDQLKAELTEKLAPLANGQPFTVTLARDDWRANFERCGGWSEWCDDVATGRDFATGLPRYTGLIVIGRALGKATADILRGALAMHKPVAVYEDGQLVTAKGRVSQAGSNPFKDWWIE